MRLFAIVAAVAAVAFAIASWPAPLPPLEKLSADAVIVAFGDSLTLGTGAQTGYPQRLEKLVNRRVVNAGIGGETSTGALRRLPGVLRQHRPALIVICTGANDLLRRQDAKKTEDNLRAIVRLARESGAQIALVAVPRFSVFPSNHPLYKRVAADSQVWLEDAALKTVLHDNALKSDMVHPNDAGYQQIAIAIAEFLRRAGAV